MAVIYTPSGESPFTIGGTTGTGPFPKYSIRRSINTSADGTLINNVYNISISGRIVSSSAVDITVSGARQSDLHDKIIQKLQLGINEKKIYGRLEIVPYGGQPHAFDFIDARLINIDIPTTDDSNSLNLFAEYNFEFEATTDASDRTPDELYHVANVSETWDLALEDGVNFDDLSNINSGTPSKIYRITHNVSATGIRSSNSDGTFSKSAWANAKDWVVSRLVTSPGSVISTDYFGGSEFTSFNPQYFNDTTTAIAIDASSYNFYNHVRTPQTSFSDGQYSISESWIGSLHSQQLDLEISLEESQNGIVTVTANGNIIGFDSNSFSNKKYNKLSNAESYLDFLESNIYDICNSCYSNSYGGTLRNIYLSKSIGRNISSGNITFNYSFDDTTQLIPNAISSELKIHDDNRLRTVNITAIIAIIAKSTGPEIQNMRTTKERRRSVQLDCVMKREYRSSAPSEGRDIVLSYAPVSDATYIDSETEDFSPTTGSYTLSIEWVY